LVKWLNIEEDFREGKIPPFNLLYFMIPDKIMVKRIKKYDRHLIVDWDAEKELFAIKRRASDGSLHHCFYVQNEDGSFRPLDDRVLKELYECDIWKHFATPGDYHKFIQQKNRDVQLKHDNIRKEYLKWWNKEHKKEWSEALENANRGIL